MIAASRQIFQTMGLFRHCVRTVWKSVGNWYFSMHCGSRVVLMPHASRSSTVYSSMDELHIELWVSWPKTKRTPNQSKRAWQFPLIDVDGFWWVYVTSLASLLIRAISYLPSDILNFNPAIPSPSVPVFLLTRRQPLAAACSEILP